MKINAATKCIFCEMWYLSRKVHVYLSTVAIKLYKLTIQAVHGLPIQTILKDFKNPTPA